jgi:ABC-type multidrug transport system fused ATPase/permease subunit
MGEGPSGQPSRISHVVYRQVAVAVTSGEDAVVVDAPGAPAAPEVLVRVEHVAKAFGPTQALRDRSFGLRAGEVHAIAGENGSGKSTLVKILSGVHAPDAGRVQIGGAVAQLRNPKGGQELDVVTVFQEAWWPAATRGTSRSIPTSAGRPAGPVLNDSRPDMTAGRPRKRSRAACR